MTDKLRFHTSDGKDVEEDRTIMIRSSMVKGMIDDGDDSEIIPLPEITSATFAKVVEFLKHLEAGNAAPEIEKPLRSNDLRDVTTEWYSNFMDLDDDTV